MILASVFLFLAQAGSPLQACVEANMTPAERQDLGAVLIGRERGDADPYDAAKRAIANCERHLPRDDAQVARSAVLTVLIIQRDFLRSEMRRDNVDPATLERWYDGLDADQTRLVDRESRDRFLRLLVASSSALNISRETLLRDHAPYARYFQNLYLIRNPSVLAE